MLSTPGGNPASRANLISLLKSCYRALRCCKPCQYHRSTWVSFRRFQKECVSTGDGDRKHPQRNHGREVEGTDTSAYAKGHPVAVRIHIMGHRLYSLAHEQRWDVACVLHHLEATQDITLGIRKGLALLLGDKLRQFTLEKRKGRQQLKKNI